MPRYEVQLNDVITKATLIDAPSPERARELAKKYYEESQNRFYTIRNVTDVIYVAESPKSRDYLVSIDHIKTYEFVISATTIEEATIAAENLISKRHFEDEHEVDEAYVVSNITSSEV